MVLLLVVVPLVELAVILKVGSLIGILPTIALLVADSVAGAWLLRREGMGVFARLRSAVRAGRVPSDEVIDIALIALGGALLLTPGFFTDVVGFILLIPPSRAVVRRIARKWFRGRFDRRLGRAHAPLKVVEIRPGPFSPPPPPDPVEPVGQWEPGPTGADPFADDPWKSEGFWGEQPKRRWTRSRSRRRGQG